MMNTAIEAELQGLADAGLIKLNFFIVKATFLAVATGTPAPAKFQIANNMDFLLQYVNGTVFTTPGTINNSPDILVELKDASSGWLYSDDPVHWMEMVGNAQNPFILPQPKLIPSNSSIMVKIQNLAAATQGRVDLSFCGSQVNYLPGADRSLLPVFA